MIKNLPLIVLIFSINNYGMNLNYFQSFARNPFKFKTSHYLERIPHTIMWEKHPQIKDSYHTYSRHVQRTIEITIDNDKVQKYLQQKNTNSEEITHEKIQNFQKSIFFNICSAIVNNHKESPVPLGHIEKIQNFIIHIKQQKNYKKSSDIETTLNHILKIYDRETKKVSTLKNKLLQAIEKNKSLELKQAITENNTKK